MFDLSMRLAGGTSTSDILWQSALFHLAGLAASVALRRRPARAHIVLVLLYGTTGRVAGHGTANRPPGLPHYV
jgi:hypothetical protein